MRSPLALVEIRCPISGEWEWSVVRTAEAARGLRAKRVILFRTPTRDEEKALEACQQVGKPVHVDEQSYDYQARVPCRECKSWDRSLRDSRVGVCCAIKEVPRKSAASEAGLVDAPLGYVRTGAFFSCAMGRRR